MTREEHLAWAKERALRYVDDGDLAGAVASLGSDLRKHSGLVRSADPALMMIGLLHVAAGDAAAVRGFIEGFQVMLTEPTGLDLVESWLSRGHRYAATCPGCEQDCSTTGVIYLAYRFATCECGEPEYAHLVEQLWHLGCVAEAAAVIVDEQLVSDAFWVLDQYRRPAARRMAERLSAWLDARAHR